MTNDWTWTHKSTGSHVDRTEFQVVSVDKSSCKKYLDIGKFRNTLKLKQMNANTFLFLGIFSCLYGEITLKRNIGNYLIKRFIPSMVIVLMSFCGFWIPTTVSPARTSIPITALLALITQQIQSDLNVSYVYALQIWNIVRYSVKLFISVWFVFLTTILFSTVLFLFLQHCSSLLLHFTQCTCRWKRKAKRKNVMKWKWPKRKDLKRWILRVKIKTKSTLMNCQSGTKLGNA